MDAVRIELVSKAVYEYVTRIESAIDKYDLSRLVDLLKQCGDVFITYSGMYASTASYMTLLLRSLTRVNALLVDPEVITYYIAPYAEEGVRRVLIINTGGSDASLARVLDQLNLTGYDVMLISFGRLSDALRYKVSDDYLVELPNNDLLYQHLIIGLVVSNYLDKAGVRGSRLWRELSSLKEIVSDLISRYVSKLMEIKEFTKEEFIVTYTPSMMGVAEDLAYNYAAGATRHLIPFNAVKQSVKYVKRILITSTDVEEYSVKEIRGMELSGAIKLCELRLRTDPLTAPVYGLMLTKALNVLSGMDQP